MKFVFIVYTYIILQFCNRKWFKNGFIHRDNDKPAVEVNDDFNDRKEWWVDGYRHRLNGPAVIDKGREEWWINGHYIK